MLGGRHRESAVEELEGGGNGVWWQNLREVAMQCRRVATKKADNGHCGSGQRVLEDDKLPAMAALRSIVDRSWHCGTIILVLYEAKGKSNENGAPCTSFKQTNMSCVSFNHDKLCSTNRPNR